MDFIGRRKIWYALSLLIIIPGIISLLLQGLNLGIDFTGGSKMDIRFSQTVNAEEVRKVVQGMGIEKVFVQKSEEKDIILRTEEIDQARQNEVIAALKDKFGDLKLLQSEKVGPTVGKELTNKALLALVIASLLMLVYISIRFEFLFGIAAIAALLHDALVTLGLFSIFQFEVDASFVAAILTVLGYSINDTIVIFDRIRENLKLHKKKADLPELVNKSIRQTLARSINTVLTVIFVLVALLVLGGSTIKLFTMALLVGVISGAYSSIFVASPLWIDLRILQKRKRQQAAAAANR